MVERLRTVYQGGVGEIVEKKSRFIATVRLVESEEEALTVLEAARKKYWDATHNCFAYVIGERRETVRCSDDGEPSGTAGRPMLDVLLGEEITNVIVIVTRYFGGTLLGTGGLVRAYSRAVQEGLAHSRLIEKMYGVRMEIQSDYTGIGKIQYLLASSQIPVLDTRLYGSGGDGGSGAEGTGGPDPGGDHRRHQRTCKDEGDRGIVFCGP